MNGRLVFALSIVLLTGQLHAMDEGSSSQAPNKTQVLAGQLPDESSGSSSRAAGRTQVQGPEQILITTKDGKKVLAPSRVLIRTSDGLETWVPINQARLFGAIREKIEDALSGEPIEFQFMGEDITLPASRIEDGIDVMSVTKPILERLLRKMYLIYSVDTERNSEDILRLSDYERKNTFKSWGRSELPLRGTIYEYIEGLLRNRLELLQASYYLDMPELIYYYAGRVRNVLLDPHVLRMLSNGEYNLLNIILESPDKLKNEIKQVLDRRKIEVLTKWKKSGNLVWPALTEVDISPDTIEKHLFIRILLDTQNEVARRREREESERRTGFTYVERNEDDSLTITPWVRKMWNSLSDEEKNTLRDVAPEVVMQIEPKKIKRAIPRPPEPVALPEESSALPQPSVRSIRPHFKQVVYPDFE